MRILNTRQWTTLLLFVLVIISLTYVAQNKSAYTLQDVSKYIESLDVGSFTDGGTLRHSKVTDNNNPEVLEKHSIELQVNELLKSKLAEEMALEREQLENEKKEMMIEVRRYANENRDLLNKVEEAQKIVELVNTDLVNVQISSFESEEPKFVKKVYSFSSKETEGKKTYDPQANELVVLSTVQGTFGHGRDFTDFFDLFHGLEIEQTKISLSLLISEVSLFNKINDFIAEGFEEIKSVKKLDDLKKTFTKITLLYAPFLESKLNIGRSQRQKATVQKQRRKVLAQMRNFLVTNGVDQEKYSLFIDADVIKLPENMLKIFIESNKDIATLRVDMMNAQGVPTHPDYDLNSWAGNRIKPTLEEEEKIDNDEEYLFIPKPGDNSIHFLDLSSNRQKFGLNNDPSACYPLKAVGGAVLFVRSEVYKLGIMFPPYYAVGTTWDRTEGWDGVETEGLCYQAASIGYECWGFPNLIAYHTTKAN